MNGTKMKNLFGKGMLGILLGGIITLSVYPLQPKQIVDPLPDLLFVWRSGKLRIINLSVMGDTLKKQKIRYM